MWRRGGTSDALKRARALLAAKSNKTQHSHNRAADADTKSRVSSSSGSDVSWDVSLLNSSREGRGAAAASHSPSKAGGGRFLKKPPPIPHEDKRQPSSQASALKKLSQKEGRILGRQREAESRTPIPGSASGPPPSRRSGRGTTPSMTGSPQAGYSSQFSWSQSMDSDEEEALDPMLSQKSLRLASPPAHLPCRDGRSLSPRAEVRLVPSGCRFSGPPAPSSDLSGSAPEEILSLEELFPLGCDAAAESSRAPSQSDLDVDMKTLENVGSAHFGNTSEGQMQVPDERGDGDSVQMVDYESDFESTKRTETGHQGSSGRIVYAHASMPVSEHHDDEVSEAVGSAATRKHYSSKASTKDWDTTCPSRTILSASGTPASHAGSFGHESLPSSSPSPGERFKDVAVQTDTDVWSAPHVPSLALNDLLRRRLAVTRRLARSSRRKRDDIIASLGPPTYAYATLHQTMEVVSPWKGGPTFPFRAVPGWAPWAKARPPDARLRDPPPGLAPEGGPRDPRPGEGKSECFSS
ncbi:uncharacterized protein C19orf44 homolog isoform X2 [Syngnathus scovelli]|uniref:uncharacterized protein C19orf44 homolog isoform X2 n=1 Tax=Syngnathus scovelli TaxID=161590 RepID=UPI00210F7BAE|nr:uncharacterized protein C19orf44 homolog isoform X2 [Syngnathus scovelli]